MWSHSSGARARRVWAAIGQAATAYSIAALVIPVVASLVAVAVGFASGHVWVGAFAAGSIGMLALIVVLLMFPLHGALRRIFYGFRLPLVEIRLEVDRNGPGRHVRSSRFITRIVRTGIRKIPDRYCCPGPAAPAKRSARRQASGAAVRRLVAHLPPRQPGHAPKVVGGEACVLGPIYDALNECWNYEMDLGGALTAGTERVVDLVQDLDFTKVAYRPRLQRTILDPTDRLVLILVLPSTAWPVHAEGEEILSGERPRRAPVTIDEAHREIRLEVDNPTFGSVYRIRWSPVETAVEVRATTITDMLDQKSTPPVVA